MGASSWDGFIVSEFGAFSQAVTDEELEQYARENAQTINHGCCTASMGRTGSEGPGSGVLNSDLTVKGTLGLRVVDASAFVRYILILLKDIYTNLLSHII